MNTLGATGPGRPSPLDNPASRGPDLEAAAPDIFGAVLGALTGAAFADAALSGDPDRPAGLREEASPEAPPSAKPGEAMNPMLLLAAVLPAGPGATPLPARASLETLVARALPASIPAAGAGMEGSRPTDLTAASRLAAAMEGMGSASLPAPEARTRVTVLRRETHFAPVLPRILAASKAIPVPEVAFVPDPASVPAGIAMPVLGETLGGPPATMPDPLAGGAAFPIAKLRAASPPIPVLAGAATPDPDGALDLPPPATTPARSAGLAPEVATPVGPQHPAAPIPDPRVDPAASPVAMRRAASPVLPDGAIPVLDAAHDVSPPATTPAPSAGPAPTVATPAGPQRPAAPIPDPRVDPAASPVATLRAAAPVLPNAPMPVLNAAHDLPPPATTSVRAAGPAKPDLLLSREVPAFGEAERQTPPGARDDIRNPQAGPAAPTPRPLTEAQPSPPFGGTAASPAIPAPAAQGAAVADPGTEPALPRQAMETAPVRPAFAAHTVPVSSGPSVAEAAPDSPVATPSPELETLRVVMPLGPEAEGVRQAPVPAFEATGDTPSRAETRRVEALRTDIDAPPARAAGIRPSPLGGTASPPGPDAVTDEPPAMLRSVPLPAGSATDPTIPGRDPAATPAPVRADPPAAREAPVPARGGVRRADDAPALPPGHGASDLPAPASPHRQEVGSYRSAEAGSARNAEAAATVSGGTTGPSFASPIESLPSGPSLSGAPPQAAPPPPAQQVASAILGQVPRGPTAAAPGASGLDGPLRILTLQLHPADLGTVLVRMRLRDGQLEMSLQASREETATLLADGGDVLTDLLRQGGYQPERVTILGGPPQPTPTDAQTFQTRTDAGPDQPPPDHPGRRQPEGRAPTASEIHAETQADPHERNHASSPDRSGVYL